MHPNKQDESQDVTQIQRQRLHKVLAGVCACLLFGLLYAFWLYLGGPGIPCVFHTLTGLDCPSCGVTHLCMALLHFDFAAAWRANAAILCLLPFFFLIALQMMRQYIKTGQTKPKRWVSVLIWVIIFILLLFGAVRNFL